MGRLVRLQAVALAVLLATGYGHAIAQAAQAPPGGLTEVRSIHLTAGASTTLFQRVAVMPDGTLLVLIKIGSGQWRLDAYRGWDGANLNRTSLVLGTDQAISGEKAQASLGLDPAGRYAVISSNTYTPYDPKTPAVKEATMPEMLTLVDLSNGKVAGKLRTDPPATIGPWGFDGDTMLTIASVPGLSFSQATNELSAWRVPQMQLLARCSHTAWVEDKNHREPDPHGCDALLKAAGASNQDDLTRHMSQQVDQRPKGSRMSWHGVSADGKLRVDWGPVPPPQAKSRTLTVRRVSDGGAAGAVTLNALHTGWAALVAGADGKDHLLVLEDNDQIAVYRCGDTH